MARRKKTDVLDEFTDETSDQVLGDILADPMAAAAGLLPHTKMDLLASGSGVKAIPDVGVPLPSFCWELLLANTVFPLGKLYVVGGAAGVGKSTFAMEIARWFGHQGGAGLIVDNENKFLSEVAASIYSSEFEVAPLHQVTSTNFKEAQSFLLEGIKYCQKKASKVDSQTGKVTGYTWPLLEILDSVTGTDTAKEAGKIISEGGISNKSYSSVAWDSAKFLPVFVALLAKVPITALAITHVSQVEKQGSFTYTEMIRKGGKSWDYSATGTFMLTKRGGSEAMRDVAPCANVPAYRAQLYNLKLDKGKYVNTVLPYWVRWFNVPYEDDNGALQTQCITKFAWHEASIAMLKAPAECKLNKSAIEAINDLVDVKEAEKITPGRIYGLYYSKPLGISKADAVSPSVFMKILYENIPVISQLRAGCGIVEGVPFMTGDEYSALVVKAKELSLQRWNARKKVQFDIEGL